LPATAVRSYTARHTPRSTSATTVVLETP